MSNKEYYSFVIVPPKSKQSVTLRFPSYIVNGIIIGSIIFIVGVISSLFFVSRIGTELTHYQQLKQKTETQESQINNFNNTVEDIQYEIQSLIEKEQEIRNILNNHSKKGARAISPKRKSKQFVASLEKQTQTIETQEEKIQTTLDLFLSKTEELNNSLGGLVTTFRDYRERFAFTPSIWPVYGRILSRYGWRYHPVTGKRKYHKGIDIPSWNGAPIRAAADGRVRYAGWSGTFGNVVVLNHKHGYQTVYAHASQLLVRNGEKVKKGQTIAQVGSTGLSTGSHVHYEVRRWKRPVSPTSYLDLDMFTAMKKLW